MNAITPVDLPHGDAAWERATEAVNAWRGGALHCLAQAELAVSETLLAMSAVPEKGSAVRLRRLVGQRFEDLRSAIASDGPFASEGVKAVAALTGFEKHQDLRPMLCHGLAKVALDRKGHWVVIFKVLVLGGREPERAAMALEQRDAEIRLEDLRRDSQRLASLLQSLRDRLGR